jgi:hypothetical protein
MAKRTTGVGNHNKSKSHKTKKRLEIKRQMLMLLNSKNRKHNRKIAAGKLIARKVI